MCAHLALCPLAASVFTDDNSGGGGDTVATLGMIAMTSVSMCLVLILHHATVVFAATDTIIYEANRVEEGHSFLVSDIVMGLVFAIINISSIALIFLAVCVFIRRRGYCQSKHHAYLPICSCILSTMVHPVCVQYSNLLLLCNWHHGIVIVALKV